MVENEIEISSQEYVSDLFGNYDENIKLIENAFSSSITLRNEKVKIISNNESDYNKTKETLESLLKALSNGEELTDQLVRYTISLSKEGNIKEATGIQDSFVCVTSSGKPIRAKTLGQKDYIKTIEKNTVVIGVGPAGTGKTYLAVAMAVKAFREQQVSRIVLTRPAVEAGEKLGFLPGDLQTKVDPYLRPLYDALFDMFGAETFNKHLERGTIEVAPLAYMRGRTLDDSFIILDEAQNTTREQMKMFLTRLGANSRAVITGDLTQTDLPDWRTSGLADAIKVLAEVEDIKTIRLSQNDVVRNKIVQEIIKAYSKFEGERIINVSSKSKSSN